MIDFDPCKGCKFDNKDNISLFGCNPCNHCWEQGSDSSKFTPKEKKDESKEKKDESKEKKDEEE